MTQPNPLPSLKPWPGILSSHSLVACKTAALDRTKRSLDVCGPTTRQNSLRMPFFFFSSLPARITLEKKKKKKKDEPNNHLLELKLDRNQWCGSVQAGTSFVYVPSRRCAHVCIKIIRWHPYQLFVDLTWAACRSWDMHTWYNSSQPSATMASQS